MKIIRQYLIVSLWVALSVTFCLGGAAYGQVSPVGQWDFTVSGAKSGSAYLTFNLDNTVTGYILVIPNTVTANEKNVPGFGYAQLSGLWQMDSTQLQVAGFLTALPPTTGVRIDITSFMGNVSNRGETFTIAGVTLDGNVTLSGVPYQAYTDLPSTWTITKTVKGQLTYTEITSVTADQSLGVNGHLYDFSSGEGADICLFGNGVLSTPTNSHVSHFGISYQEFAMPTDDSGCGSIDPTNSSSPPLHVVTSFGTLDLTTGKATLTGYENGTPPIKVTTPMVCQ
jgi:hypothetical protein